jgi:uncharacterized membrane protein
MLQLPPWPTWDSLHPLIIHFPIVLLLLSPFFIVIGATLPVRLSHPYRIVALMILLLGTASLFLAASTGEAAGEMADCGGPVDAVLQRHEELASQARIVFAVLSAILLAIYFLPPMLRRQEGRTFTTVLPLVFLVPYAFGILVLINTAHAGGRLVHEFGIHALVPATSSPPGVVPGDPEQKGD